MHVYLSEGSGHVTDVTGALESALWFETFSVQNWESIQVCWQDLGVSLSYVHKGEDIA